MPAKLRGDRLVESVELSRLTRSLAMSSNFRSAELQVGGSRYVSGVQSTVEDAAPLPEPAELRPGRSATCYGNGDAGFRSVSRNWGGPLR